MTSESSGGVPPSPPGVGVGPFDRREQPTLVDGADAVRVTLADGADAVRATLAETLGVAPAKDHGGDGEIPSTSEDAPFDAAPDRGASERALPGLDGFAGAVDGWLVRDTLGRRPLYYAADEPNRYAFAPGPLENPELLPAGAVLPPDASEPQVVWSLPDPPADDAGPATERVERAVVDAMETCAAGAVAFSGGIDSALVAGGLPDATLYVAGFEGAHDLTAARETAAAAGRELVEIEMTHGRLREAVMTVVEATGLSNPMDTAIAAPLYLVARRAAADGHERLALGQGADELFGGYAKVVEPADDDRVAADTVRGARRETIEALPDQLARDVCTIRAAGVEPAVPFLSDSVIDAALRLPGEAIADADGRKLALRAAGEGRVPETARTADKKALQYGTYAARELDRLARQAGFKRRMDDHVGRYVDALVTDELDERPREE